VATPTDGTPPNPRRNLLLRSLPEQEFTRLRPLLEPVALDIHDELYEVGAPIEHLYFPVDAVLSLLAVVEGEAPVEVATVGYEGMAGLPAFLGSAESVHHTVCQVAGTAVRLTTADLRRFLEQDGALHDLLHRYTQATMVQLSQSVACNRLHTTEERAARWLLQTRDRVGADDFALTREFLAQMLGVRRGSVSITVGLLQQAGVIRYTRGRISVRDAAALHEVACDCYDIVQAQYRRLTAAPEP
jgi:CRP-like cAMP-binding protein